MCDVRPMHPDDVMPMWHKVSRYLKDADYKYDDEDHLWFISIGFDGGSQWRFSSTAHGVRLDPRAAQEAGRFAVDWTRVWITLSYYPPNGGRVRFDASIDARDMSNPQVVNTMTLSGNYNLHFPDLVREYCTALVNYGHLGKNRLAYFEKLDEPAPPKPVFPSNREILEGRESTNDQPQNQGIWRRFWQRLTGGSID